MPEVFALKAPVDSGEGYSTLYISASLHSPYDVVSSLLSYCLLTSSSGSDFTSSLTASVYPKVIAKSLWRSKLGVRDREVRKLGANGMRMNSPFLMRDPWVAVTREMLRSSSSLASRKTA